MPRRFPATRVSPVALNEWTRADTFAGGDLRRGR
jgi:hypothetical protein